MFEAKVITEALKHAALEYPKESCGLVVDGNYLPRNNTHIDPESSFKISPQAYLAAGKSGEIQGVIHSHPEGQLSPSISDLKSQMESGLPWGILPRGNDPFWFGDQTPIAPLEGRMFRYGVHDCFTIVRDWYRVNRNVTLKFIPSEEKWWEKGENIYFEKFEELGFHKIEDDSWEIGDVLMGAVQSDVLNHIALYCGGSEIIHHFPNRLSLKVVLGSWRRALPLRLRYKK